MITMFWRLLVTAFLVVLVGCASDEGPGAALETLDPDEPATTELAQSTSSSTSTSTTTTPTSTTETTEVSVVESVYGDYELTWAEQGTEVADVERAFWRAQEVAHQAFISVDETDLDTAFAGESLQWQIEEVERIRELGTKIVDNGTREYQLDFVIILDDGRAQIQACRLDTDTWFLSSGEVAEDSGVNYETSYLSMLSKSPEGEWFVVSGTTDFDRPLEEGERPSCFSDT